MMTKKNFINAAKIAESYWNKVDDFSSTSDTPEVITARAVENSFKELFLNDNPRFDALRFSKACRGK